MAFTNWASTVLRASAVTVGTSEQDADVTLPETVGGIFVFVTKTAEAAADNLLTVRLQCKVGALYCEVDWEYSQLCGSVTVAADNAPDTTRTANILDADSTAPSFSKYAYYPVLLSNVVRIVSVTSGTTPTHTFSVTAFYRLNNL